MAKLILSVDQQVLKEVTLTKERTLVGRKPHNDVQIDNLAVSGEHAAIITILNDSFIEDLNSTNGTIVNGKPIKKHFLQNGDVIEIGKHKLKYFNDQPNAATAADFEKTMVIRTPVKASAPSPDIKLSDTQMGMQALEGAGHVVKAAEPVAAPPVASGAPLREAQIQVLSGGQAGRTLDLTKNLTTIGKPGTQVAVITKRPNGYFITHVEGATFPQLNGSELTAQATQLNDHDMIEIAGIKMEFFYKP
jgi:pSer/pThr/pTyr-binding forkhead associated (FHA) protein